MGSSRAIALAMLLGGCAQLAGIDETSAPADAPPPENLSLSVERISIGTTIARNPVDLTGGSATYLVAADEDVSALTPVMATLEPPNTWRAELDTPAIVEFTLPEMTPTLRSHDFPSRALTTAWTVLEHPNPGPAPADATLSFAITSDVPYSGAEGYQYWNIGAWTRIGLAPPAVVGETALAPATVPWTTTVAMNGHDHDAITVADSNLVLRYMGNRLEATFEAPPFDQTAADTITGTLVPNPLDQALSFAWDAAAIQARFAALRPTPATLDAAWYLHAAPGAMIANNSGILLHARGIPDTDMSPITAMYGNPFAAKWPTVMSVNAFERRTYSIPGGSMGTIGVTLTSGLQQQLAPADGVTFPAELPAQIELGGTLLSTDGIEVRLPTKPAILTFTTPTPAAFYGLSMYEVLPTDDGEALTFRHIFSRTGKNPRFPITPDKFEVGKTYMLRVHSYVGGYTGIDDGDLRPNDIAFATAFHDAGVFKVVP